MQAFSNEDDNLALDDLMFAGRGRKLFFESNKMNEEEEGRNENTHTHTNFHTALMRLKKIRVPRKEDEKFQNAVSRISEL